mgnify:CR=1 FL=1
MTAPARGREERQVETRLSRVAPAEQMVLLRIRRQMLGLGYEAREAFAELGGHAQGES